MKRISFILILCMLMGCLSFVGCLGEVEDGGEGFTIVCSIFPQYDFCRIISGGLDEVILLQQNGVDMHSYEATSRDIVTVSRADMLIYTGGGSDTWVEGMLRSAKNGDIITASLFDWASVLPVGEGHEHDHEHEHAEGEACSAYDEHVWTSPKNAIKIVLGMCETMCRANPENADAYRKNTEKYIEELTALDAEYENFFALASPTLIIADRNPFAYLIHDYGVDCHAAFTGCSSEVDASFEVIISLIHEAQSSGVSTVFDVDNSGSDIAGRISETCGLNRATLYSCQSVTTRQLQDGESYLSFMEKNLQTLKEAYNVNI